MLGLTVTKIGRCDFRGDTSKGAHGVVIGMATPSHRYRNWGAVMYFVAWNSRKVHR